MRWKTPSDGWRRLASAVVHSSVSLRTGWVDEEFWGGGESQARWRAELFLLIEVDEDMARTSLFARAAEARAEIEGQVRKAERIRARALE